MIALVLESLQDGDAVQRSIAQRGIGVEVVEPRRVAFLRRR
jgi:hypothetical protein